MASYAFGSITAGQAMSIQPTDVLSLEDVPATSVTVLYNPTSITIIAGGRSVEFALNISNVSLANGISAADGSRLFIGGPGNDSLNLSTLDILGDQDTRSDAIFGGAGNDNLNGGGGRNLLQGNQGNDTLSGGSTIYGGQDNDIIRSSNFGQGNKGDDSLIGGSGAQTLLGGQGSDTIDGDGGVDFLNGNLGDDLIDGAGHLFGEAGDDSLRVFVSGVNSTLDGGAGDDLLIASPDAFTSMIGGDGNDLFLVGSNGTQSISGGDGGDTVLSDNNRSQTVMGGAGDDEISLHGVGLKMIDGGDGNDWIDLEGGWGQVLGSAGNDTVTMSHTGDFSTVYGGDGDDVLTMPQFETQGAFQVLVGWGGVTMDGGAGNDILAAGAMIGGAGADQFSMGWTGDPNIPHGARVLDWSSADKILLPSVLDRAQIAYSEASAANFEAALALFQQSGYGNHVMAIQVGADVVVFAAGSANLTSPLIDAVDLVGRSLADIDVTKLA